MTLSLLKKQNLITFLSVQVAVEEEKREGEADGKPAIGTFVESSIFWFFLVVIFLSSPEHFRLLHL